MMKNENVWDLSQLVDSTDPALIKKELDSMVADTSRFRESYRDKIADLDAHGLLELLELRDEMTLKYEGVIRYCSLKYSADSTDDVAKQLRAYTASKEGDQNMAFFDIELGKLLTNKPSLVTDPVLAEYGQYLKRILRSWPHMLSETKERLIIAKDKNGVNAWRKLQSDWLSTRTFDIEVEGEMKTLHYAEITALYSSEGDLGRKARQVVYEGLGENSIIWASALRAIFDNHQLLCKLRKYPTPITKSLIAGDIDQEAVDSLMSVVETNLGLYRRYLKLKAKLMGVDKLDWHNMRAPLHQIPEKKYSWEESRREVVGIFKSLDGDMGGFADEMYEKRRIDGEIRKGKRPGAFASSWTAGKGALVLQSFKGNVGDVYTQAHEVGHAVHSCLASRAQKPINVHANRCMAECASIFSELLLTERLLSKAKTKEEKQTVLASTLDKFGHSAFRTSASFFFEHSLHNAIERGEFLDGETISKLWITARDKIYGDSVDFIDVTKWTWTTIGQHYERGRFNNYPYVFAKLFAFALYSQYKEQGKEFVHKLKAFLAAGSSRSASELASEFGFDISQKSFWMKGMKQAEEFIDMLEETL